MVKDQKNLISYEFYNISKTSIGSLKMERKKNEYKLNLFVEKYFINLNLEKNDKNHTKK